MAEPENLDDEFFADLYADDEPAAAPSKSVALERTSGEMSIQDAMIDDAPSNQASNGDGHAMNEDSEEEEDDDDIDFNLGDSSTNIPSASGSRPTDTPVAAHTPTPTPVPAPSKGPSAKEDG